MALVTDPSVDSLTKQIGVVKMLGVLLDQVHKNFAPRDSFAAPKRPQGLAVALRAFVRMCAALAL